MFGFPRRDFLKTLAWLFGASQVPAATAQAAADATASSTPTTAAQASPPGVASMPLTPGQFEAVRGYADTKLRFPDRPLEAGNRRISILVRR